MRYGSAVQFNCQICNGVVCTKEFRDLGYFPNNTHLNFNYFLSVFGKNVHFLQVYMLCHNKVLPKTVFWERKNINQYMKHILQYINNPAT